MKKTLLLGIGIVFISACGTAQKNAEIPSVVKNAFESRFPGVEKPKWEKEGANYEAEFETGETETSAVFDASGNLLETENEIETAQLPANAREYVEKNYKGQKIKEAAKITYPDGKINYEAEIKGQDLIFDANGTFIKTTK